MSHILPTSVTETIGEETEDYFPAFTKPQPAETVQTLLQHTDRKRRFVVLENDRSTVFSMVGSRRMFFLG